MSDASNLHRMHNLHRIVPIMFDAAQDEAAELHAAAVEDEARRRNTDWQAGHRQGLAEGRAEPAYLTFAFGLACGAMGTVIALLLGVAAKGGLQ